MIEVNLQEKFAGFKHTVAPKVPIPYAKHHKLIHYYLTTIIIKDLDGNLSMQIKFGGRKLKTQEDLMRELQRNNGVWSSLVEN